MVDLLNFMPREAGGVFDWLLQTGLGFAARDNIKPVAVAPVFGDAAFVGSEQNGSGGGANAFDFDQAKLTGVEIEARDVVAEILLVNIINLQRRGDSSARGYGSSRRRYQPSVLPHSF